MVDSVIPSRTPGQCGSHGGSRQLCQKLLSGTGSFSRKIRMDSFRIVSPLPNLHHGFLESSSPSNRLHHLVLFPSFGPLFPQGNSFLCTLIGSSGSSWLFLLSNSVLIFLSSLLTHNLCLYYSYPISLCSCYSFPQALSYILGTHHTEEEPSKESHSHYSRDQSDEEDFPWLQGPTGLPSSR